MTATVAIPAFVALDDQENEFKSVHDCTEPEAQAVLDRHAKALEDTANESWNLYQFWEKEKGYKLRFNDRQTPDSTA